MPFYKLDGPLAGFAAYTNHISVGLVSSLEDEDRRLLEEAGYVTGKKTIQINFDQRVPAAAIRRLLKREAKLNAAKEALKKPGK